MSDTYILTLNAGSSSLKFALFDDSSCVGRGAITGLGTKPDFSFKSDLLAQSHIPPLLPDDCRTTAHATQALIEWLEKSLPTGSIKAVGHRVVHGGDRAQSMLVTKELRAQLEKLIPLAPLHQPFNLEAVDLITKFNPDIPQVACFDTSFHATMPPLHRRFALPRKWHDEGVKRYGFHGLSYEYITGRLRETSQRAFQGRTIAAHLGNGASLCALKGGQSFDTSMGFSALDGLVMGTRPGTLDAGVMLYFMQHAKLDESTIEHVLYRESGLLGVSGISADMKTLLESNELTAREAIDLFCLRIAREAGGLISLMGGIDAFVFTGGIGEHGTEIRAQVAASMEWAKLALDTGKNDAATGNEEQLLSTPQSAVEIRLIPTDEESVIARHVREVLKT